MKLKQVSYKELKDIKKELLEEQGYICPISQKPLKMDKEAVVDHKHKLFKDQPLGEDGAGLIRGILDFRVNAWEGKVFNSFKRLGLHKFDASLPDMLRRLADYLEKETTNYIHPAEKPKEKKLGKRKFNKIAKLYAKEKPKAKPLEYPKSKKITKKILELSKKYNIEL